MDPGEGHRREIGHEATLSAAPPAYGRVSIMADVRAQRVYPLDAAIAATTERPDDDPRAWALSQPTAVLSAGAMGKTGIWQLLADEIPG